ncbi:hypothetical protein [Actinocorallia aurea]
MLHQALRDVASRLGEDGVGASVDDQDRLHVAALSALPEPPSLLDLRERAAGMLPRVDLPEVLLETMGRVPAFTAAFGSAAGADSRLADFNVSVAACLTAQARPRPRPRTELRHPVEHPPQRHRPRPAQSTRPHRHPPAPRPRPGSRDEEIR